MSGETVKMSLARALKEKNRIVKKMQQLEMNLRYNVYEEGEKPGVDVAESYTQYHKLQEYLIDIKSAMAEANAESGVTALLIEKAETVSLMHTISGMNTEVTSRRNRNPVTGQIEEIKRIAFIQPDVIQKELDELQDKIYILQDRIDSLNANTYIEVIDRLK